MARPTKYNPDYHPERALRLSKLGLIGREIAFCFGVAESTYELWKTKYPEFSESIKRGSLVADAHIAQKLYERAIGAKRTIQEAHVISVGPDREAVQIVQTEIEDAPCLRAIRFWLKHRQPILWSELS